MASIIIFYIKNKLLHRLHAAFLSLHYAQVQCAYSWRQTRYKFYGNLGKCISKEIQNLQNQIRPLNVSLKTSLFYLTPLLPTLSNPHYLVQLAMNSHYNIANVIIPWTTIFSKIHSNFSLFITIIEVGRLNWLPFGRMKRGIHIFHVVIGKQLVDWCIVVGCCIQKTCLNYTIKVIKNINKNSKITYFGMVERMAKREKYQTCLNINHAFFYFFSRVLIGFGGNMLQIIMFLQHICGFVIAGQEGIQETRLFVVSILILMLSFQF